MSNDSGPSTPAPGEHVEGWAFYAWLIAGILVFELAGPPLLSRIITWSGGRPHDPLPNGARFALGFAWLAILLCITSLLGLGKPGGPRPIRLTRARPAAPNHTTLLAWVQWLIGFVAMGAGYYIGTVWFT